MELTYGTQSTVTPAQFLTLASVFIVSRRFLAISVLLGLLLQLRLYMCNVICASTVDNTRNVNILVPFATRRRTNQLMQNNHTLHGRTDRQTEKRQTQKLQSSYRTTQVCCACLAGNKYAWPVGFRCTRSFWVSDHGCLEFVAKKHGWLLICTQSQSPWIWEHMIVLSHPRRLWLHVTCTAMHAQQYMQSGHACMI